MAFISCYMLKLCICFQWNRSSHTFLHNFKSLDPRQPRRAVNLGCLWSNNRTALSCRFHFSTLDQIPSTITQTPLDAGHPGVVCANLGHSNLVWKVVPRRKYVDEQGEEQNIFRSPFINWWLNTNAWFERAVVGEEWFPNITWFKGLYSIARHASHMFCQKSDSALSSSRYGADFRGTRVWTCSQLNSWASIERRGSGGGRLFQISHTKGALIRRNAVLHFSLFVCEAEINFKPSASSVFIAHNLCCATLARNFGCKWALRFAAVRSPVQHSWGIRLLDSIQRAPGPLVNGFVNFRQLRKLWTINVLWQCNCLKV